MTDDVTRALFRNNFDYVDNTASQLGNGADNFLPVDSHFGHNFHTLIDGNMTTCFGY